MNIFNSYSILSCAVALLTACSSTPTASSSANTSSTSASASSASAAPQAVGGSTVATASLPAYLDANSPIAINRSVYFDFDAYLVKKEYDNMLEQHGKYLASHPSVAIKIEGNTDDRGGAEYNLALGQKRAEVTRRALMVYGAKAAQMEAVSWGKEKPKATGHDEASWKENRRADLDYPKQ